MEEQPKRRRRPVQAVLPPQDDEQTPASSGAEDEDGVYHSVRPWHSDPLMQSYLAEKPAAPAKKEPKRRRSASVQETEDAPRKEPAPQMRTGAAKERRAAQGKALSLRMGAKTESPQPEQEIILEPIRKEDSHGRAERYRTGHAKPHLPDIKLAVAAGRQDAKKRFSGARPADMGTKNAGAKKSAERQAAHAVKRTARSADVQDRARMILSIVLMCVAVFSLIQIAGILIRTVRTKSLNAQLSQRRAELAANAQTENGANLPEGFDEDALVIFEGEAQQTPQAAQTTSAPENTPMPEATGQPQATAQPTPDKQDAVKSTKFRKLGGNPLPEMEALYNENRDLVGWINIPDVLDLPVVYKDNSYYLKRDFYKKSNTSGTIFLDVNHPFKEKTQNLLLHGHNMKDGTMFGRLTQYLYDDTYLRNHPFVNFNTLWDQEQYVIFAVLNVSLDVKNERFFNYFTHDTFASDAEFNSFVRQLQLRSEYAIPISVEPSDALLTLSTCLEDDRLVIVCRRLREGETRSELRAHIRTATRQ